MSNTNADKLLEPDEIATDEDLANGLEDDGLGPTDENEDEPGVPTRADRENQAGTEKVDPNKFQRD